jgi:CubicO group peptidase (beta-lactamase class C family)
MRDLLLKLVACAALLAAAAPANAQDPDPFFDAPPEPPPARAVLPDAPMPYAQTRPARRVVRPSAPQAAPAPAAAVPASTVIPVGAPLPPVALEAFIDGMVADAMAREHIAGVSVAVVQNGQVLLKKGYGFADLDPLRKVDPDRTLFRIGSISKTFTWITLMRQVEAGKIRLNQPVNLYLPPKVAIPAQGFSTPIRVANLMDHSAGFEDRALGHLFEREFDRVRPLDLYLRQERPRRVRAPGAVSSYSNYGVALAGMAAAYQAGKPFEALVEDDILRPLGMTRTTFREPHPGRAGLPDPMPASLAQDLSDGYRWTPTGYALRDFEYVGQIGPAGSASSTAGDMSRYMLALLGDGALEGVTVFGPATARAFRTPLRKTPAGINGWAHGFVQHDLPGGRAGYGHDGATLSFMSNMLVVPSLGLGVFVTTNTDTGGPLTQRLPAAVVRQFYGPPQAFPRPGSPELVNRARLFSGYYLATRRPYRGLEGFVMMLRSGAQVSVNPQGRLLLTGGAGVGAYVPEGDINSGRFIGVRDDSRLAFDVRRARAPSFTNASGAMQFERAPFWKQTSVLALMAGLTAAASLVTLAGMILRGRRTARENQVQARAAILQNIQAGLWLVSLGVFARWAAGTGDVAKVLYGWPDSLLVTASASALVAGALTIVTVIALPTVWSGGRRVESWTGGRKAAFSLTVLIYALFGLQLAMWGALSPWVG